MMADLAPWFSLGVATFVALIGLLQFLTAREQARTANNRAVLDLFEKRYAVYEGIRSVVGKVLTHGSANMQKMQVFMEAAVVAEKAKFLFKEDINGYLKQFLDDLTRLECLESERKTLQHDGEQKNLNSQQQIRDRIALFYKDGAQRFAPYIRFDHKLR